MRRIFSRSHNGVNYAIVHNLLNAEKYFTVTEGDIYISLFDTICERNLGGVN